MHGHYNNETCDSGNRSKYTLIRTYYARGWGRFQVFLARNSQCTLSLADCEGDAPITNGMKLLPLGLSAECYLFSVTGPLTRRSRRAAESIDHVPNLDLGLTAVNRGIALPGAFYVCK